MSKIDDFFDAADKIADKVVGTLKDVHYPGKEERDATDAEFREIHPAKIPREVILGSVSLSDGSGNYFHLFVGFTNKTFCKQTIDVSRIKTRKRPNPESRDFLAVCYGCVSELIAFQTQETEPSLKELTDGSD